jgi:hypothetical protein
VTSLIVLLSHDGCSKALRCCNSSLSDEAKSSTRRLVHEAAGVEEFVAFVDDAPCEVEAAGIELGEEGRLEVVKEVEVKGELETTVLFIAVATVDVELPVPVIHLAGEVEVVETLTEFELLLTQTNWVMPIS